MEELGIDYTRRVTVNRMSAPEVEIHLANKAIEGLPPHPNLTQAQNKLQEAQKLVADFIDTDAAYLADHLSKPLDPKTIDLYKKALALCNVFVEPYVVELALKIFNAVQILGDQFSLKDAASITALVKKIHGDVENQAVYNDVRKAISDHFKDSAVSK